MGGNVPRRLKRFQRKMDRGESVSEEVLGELEEQDIGPAEEETVEDSIFSQVSKESPEEQKKKTMQLALKEVKMFKEKHKRLPKKEEFEQIAENIFTQLSEEREKEKVLKKMDRAQRRSSKKGPKRREREESVAEEEKPIPRKKEVSDVLRTIKDLDVNDLFEEGAEKKQPGKKQREDSLSELSQLGLDSGEEISVKELQDEREQEQQECPSCKATGAEVIYCPGCGNAYCKKCAKKSEKLPDGRTKYYCPVCGSTVEK